MAEIIWENLIKANSNVNQYLNSADELEKLMNAEIITQFPKIDKDVELNGTIEFKRYKTDGTSVILKYINLQKFNDSLKSNDINIVNNFTVDESGNVLIGVVDETTEELTSNDSEMMLNDYTDTLNESNSVSTGKYSKTEYNVVSKVIPYKSVVSKYTMPFQYLWSLIIAGGDKDFGLELADLVEDSEIVIAIYDNITTTVNTTIYTYNREKKIDVSATAKATTSYGDSATKSDSWKPAKEWKESDEYKINHVITYKNNRVVIDIIKADVWIVDYSKDYTYKNIKQISEDSNNKYLNDTKYIGDANNPVGSEKGDGSDLLNYDKFKDKLRELMDSVEKLVKSDEIKYDKNNKVIEYKVSSSITSCTANYYKHNVNIKEENIATTYSQKYIPEAGGIHNRPKVEKDENEKNFVTILCDVKHRSAKRELAVKNTKMLFKILKNNPDTVDMVDLTRYLLYKATNDKDLKSSYDFSEYENNDFITIGDNSSYGDWTGEGSTNDFIKAVAPYAVIDMQQHNIYASVTIAQAIIESGWGKDNIAINYKNFFGMKTRGISNTGNEYWDGTGVALNASEGGTSYFRVYDSLANSVYDHGRNFHVTATYSAHGVLECMEKNLGPKEQLRRIALSGYAVMRDGSISKPDGVHTYDEYLYEKFIVKYNLTQYDSMSSTDFEAVGNGDIVDIAKSKIGCAYQLGADGPNTFDCSGLVYWVFGQKGISVPRSTTSYSSYIGSDKEISWEEAQPGDILIILASERGTTYGHAAIYLGNNEYIHAPKPGDSVKISSGATSHFKHVFRF